MANKNSTREMVLQSAEMVELAKTYLYAAEAKMLDAGAFAHKEKLSPRLREQIQNAQKQIELASRAVRIAMSASDTVCIQLNLPPSKEEFR